MEYKKLVFQNLSLQQLYDILQLRSEVFVVEQDCVYQDIDNYDQISTHILAYDKGLLVAYSRILPPNTYFDKASIGRVITKESHRKLKLGHKLMQESISYIEETYGKQPIKISAQQYLIKFYSKHGFKPKGEGYLEDGIPHIAMYR
jgi:ElaA protein